MQSSRKFLRSGDLKRREKSVAKESIESAAIFEPLLVDVCWSRSDVNDGHWHTLLMKRLGHDLSLQLDNREPIKSSQILSKRQTFASNHQTRELGSKTGSSPFVLPNSPPIALRVDKRDGVTIGGVPFFDDMSLVTVAGDLKESELMNLLPYQ